MSTWQKLPQIHELVLRRGSRDAGDELVVNCRVVARGRNRFGWSATRSALLSTFSKEDLPSLARAKRAALSEGRRLLAL